MMLCWVLGRSRQPALYALASWRASGHAAVCVKVSASYGTPQDLMVRGKMVAARVSIQPTKTCTSPSTKQRVEGHLQRIIRGTNEPRSARQRGEAFAPEVC